MIWFLGINAAVSLIALVAGIFAMIFGAPANKEELERASMRSLSWPTDNKSYGLRFPSQPRR